MIINDFVQNINENTASIKDKLKNTINKSGICEPKKRAIIVEAIGENILSKPINKLSLTSDERKFKNEISESINKIKHNTPGNISNISNEIYGYLNELSENILEKTKNTASGFISGFKENEGSNIPGAFPTSSRSSLSDIFYTPRSSLSSPK